MTEVERMIYENCRNVAHGRQTNFQRITASPEALADFIENHSCEGMVRHIQPFGE